MDGHGRKLWRTKLGEINKGGTVAMAPLVVKGRCWSATAMASWGGSEDWLSALDAATGRIAWRAYSTGPDQDVLIGPDYKPFYAQDQGQDLGIETWPPEQWGVHRRTHRAPILIAICCCTSKFSYRW